MLRVRVHVRTSLLITAAYIYIAGLVGWLLCVPGLVLVEYLLVATRDNEIVYMVLIGLTLDCIIGGIPRTHSMGELEPCRNSGCPEWGIKNR